MKRIHKGLYSEKDKTISHGWKGWELWETQTSYSTGEIFYNKLIGIYQSKSQALAKAEGGSAPILLRALKRVEECLDNQFQTKDELIPGWIVEAYEVIEEAVSKAKGGAK